jgi:predicted DNA binding protein
MDEQTGIRRAMIRAQFRIRLPEGIWVRELSESFPDARFRLLSGLRDGDRAVELGEVVADDPDAAVEAMRAHASIDGLELLESGDERALARYETTDTALYGFVEAVSLPVEFPLTVERGWYEFDLTGTREELDSLRTFLDNSPLPYELRSLVETTETDTLLTDRQREVLETAVREGYFEVPRTCTLADIADELDIDKSTASTVLRRGESRLVKRYLTGPDGE